MPTPNTAIKVHISKFSVSYTSLIIDLHWKKSKLRPYIDDKFLLFLYLHTFVGPRQVFLLGTINVTPSVIYLLREIVNILINLTYIYSNKKGYRVKEVKNIVINYGLQDRLLENSIRWLVLLNLFKAPSFMTS